MKANNSKGYFTKSDIIESGEYKETELDLYKKSVDFLITSCGNRYEIIFNHKVNLKVSRSIAKINQLAYLVTEKALESLKDKYTYACDF